MDVGGRHAQLQPGQDRDRGDAEDDDRHQRLDQRRSVVGAGGRAQAGEAVHQTSTWLKMPYIAETSAMATKPTIPPITMMTSGSKIEVSFLIL